MSVLANQEEASPETGLLAGFQVLVGRCAGQEAFCIGLPVAGRAEYARQIGPYEDLLPLRVDLAAAPDFRSLLRHSQRELDELYAHQEVPFDLLLETLSWQREPSLHPICQVLYCVEATRKPPITGACLLADPTEINIAINKVEIEEVSKFDLTLIARAADSGMHLTLDYNADLFDRSTAERMLRRLQALLEDAVSGPDRPCSELSLLDAQERHQLLTAWNETDRKIDFEMDAEMAGEMAIPELIEAQAKRTPNAVAAVFGPERISYRELDRGSNRFARYFKTHGIGEGARVGLCLPRSFEMLMAVLGILKTGAAYVPLDAAYPRERLEMMLEDAGLQALLTHSSLLSSLPASPHPTCLILDAEAQQITRESDAPLDRLPRQDRLIYLTYTSGSTGKPKGIEMTQRP